VDLGPANLPAELALTLYRAAQEGITNALRHGEARHLQLTVRADERDVNLSLVDDGKGLPADWAQRTGHYGLRWLAERAQALQGRLDVEPATPRGVQLRLRVPHAQQVPLETE
jgi:two-component system, NarL family, sensor histidine kinase UhpB